MNRRLPAALAAAAAALLPLAGCTSGQQPHATLRPTLEVRRVDGGLVAFQGDLPVPEFGVQPRPRLDLDGPWRFEATQLDDGLSLGDRRRTLPGLTREAGGRLVDE